MRAIERCRSAQLGGHLHVCPACGNQEPRYNSCRDRHCPKCQAFKQAKWLAGRMQRVLPVTYYHVVFTLPAQLRALAVANRRRVFHLLFRSSADTLLELGRDPKRLGVHLGITAVLHTWTRTMQWHPHLHCVVTAGGLATTGSSRWVHATRGFLFPVQVMSKLMRGKFMAGLEALRRDGRLVEPASEQGCLADEGFKKLKAELYAAQWVVYSKAPFDGASHVFSYLSRYTHRVAISNQRLLRYNDDGVEFATKNGQTETVTPAEFVRRFMLHVLPPGFVKMRHYGLMAPNNVHTRLETARRLLLPNEQPAPTDTTEGQFANASWQQMLRYLTGIDVDTCRVCGHRGLVRRPLPEILDTS